ELELGARGAEIGLSPGRRQFATKAAKNKCLAKSNKSRVQGKATNRHARHKNWQSANASMTNALEQTRRDALLLGAAALVSSLAPNVESGHNTETPDISPTPTPKYTPHSKHIHH